MMRSLSSAVAGLRTHQTKMDVVGNNIANVNTYGFKASRTTFADVYYQNLSGGRSGQTGTRGGTNPTQIGYGSAIATIDVMMGVAGAASTGKPLDVRIAGEGFIVSKDTSGQTYYSRLGNMIFDPTGNLVDGNGNRIMGFPMKKDENGNDVPDISADGTITGDRLEGIKVDPAIFEALKSISVSNTGAITALLEGDNQVTASTGSNPSWFNSNTLSIPATSTYKGAIRVAISGFCDDVEMARVLGINQSDIKSMEMGTLALPQSGDYKVSIDGNGNVTVNLAASTSDPPGIWDAVSLTGSLKNNQLVLKNKSNDVAMTINFANNVTFRSTSVTTTNPPDIAPSADATHPTEYFDIDGNSQGFVATTTNPNGYPLYQSTSTSGTPVPLTDGGTPPLQLYAAVTTTTTNTPQSMNLTLYQQMTTTDKGGNTVKYPNPPEAYTPGTNPRFDELTFEITGDVPPAGFNGIIGYAEPGESVILNIGNLVLAKFRNSSGLEQSGTSYFMESLNSGEATYVLPGSEGTGGLQSGYLEMSGVDLSQEMTDMITTQRGFQANSRIITVSDEMLQELVNLKR